MYRGAECGSDHYLLKASIEWPWIKRSKQSVRKEQNEMGNILNERFDTVLLKEESVRTLYRQRLKKEINGEFKGSAEEMYLYMNSLVRKVAKEVLGAKNTTRRRTSWLTEEVLQLIEEKKRAFRKWL